MFLLSKILAKEWFKSLIGSLIVLFLLITVGDILNGFLQNYPPRRVLMEYLLKLPEFAGKMLPISTLLASLFSLNKLKNHSELMGILAAGFSAKKIYSLILMCSLSVAAFQFFNLGYIVPFANKIKRQEFEKSRKNESKYLARSTIGKSGYIWYKSDNYFTSFQAYDAKKKALKNVFVYFLSKDKKLDTIYRASTAEFIAKNQWKLHNVSVVQSLNSANFPSKIDMENMLIELRESPLDFKQFESDITTLNLLDLGRFISRLDESEITTTEYEVMYYDKFSLALICIVFSLFPLATIFNPNRRGSSFGKSIVFTLIFTIGFFMAHSAVISLGTSGKVPVILATLGIPGLIASYIVFNFQKNRRL